MWAPATYAGALDNMSGNAFYRFCTSKGDQGIGDAGPLLCLGYLDAITDILSSGASIAGHKACIPRAADENQIVDIAKQYIQSHPETRHLPAYILVSQALSASFTCPLK